MTFIYRFILLAMLLGVGAPSFAQDVDADIDYDNDSERLKEAAIEALMSAPPERALPIVARVLRGDDSDDLKESALFVLSQIDHPDAESLLVDVARTSSGDLQEEAVRMIGISGNTATLAELRNLYRDGDEDLREAVLEAFLIADDPDSIVAVMEFAETEDELEEAIETLGAMRAMDHLRALRNRDGISEALIEAYAIAGDVESLRELAMDSSDPERQAEAIEGLAIAGGDNANDTFAEIYRSADNEDVREAALEAMMIAGDDEAVLELFHESTNPREKRELLELLVIMDSDAVWDIIDATLEDD